MWQVAGSTPAVSEGTLVVLRPSRPLAHRRYPPKAAHRPPGPTPSVFLLPAPGAPSACGPVQPPKVGRLGLRYLTPTAAAGFPPAAREPRSPGTGGDPRAYGWRSACQPSPTA